MTSRALLLSLVLVVPACGGEPNAGELATDASPRPVAVSHGDVFEADLAALGLATDWVWELAAADSSRQTGSCGYGPDLANRPSGRWHARYSTDAEVLDPVTQSAYANGYWTLVADGMLPQVPTYATPSRAYHCSTTADASPLFETERVDASIHVEMALGMEPDGVHFSGYVTRLFMSGLAAPLDVSNGRPVLLGVSIPAPLRVHGSLQSSAADPALVNGRDRGAAIEIVLAAQNGAGPPEFEFDVGVPVRGMWATSRVQLENLLLAPAPL